MSHEAGIGIYLPQAAFTFDDLLQRARWCEDLGLGPVWLFDHLYTPFLPEVPALEGWTLATALLARTERLRVGHLVLCNQFRHPALTAKMAATLAVISGGRLELGLGSGSYEREHHEAGLAWGSFAERSERLGEALEIVTRMLTGEPTTYTGRHYALDGLPCLPVPPERPPIHVGGIGVRHTLPLAARYADVWNLPTYAHDKVDASVAALDAACVAAEREPATLRRSMQAVLVLGADADAVAVELTRAERRYGDPSFGLHAAGFIGTPDVVAARIREVRAAGFSDLMFFTADRGGEATLSLLAEAVVPQLG